MNSFLLTEVKALELIICLYSKAVVVSCSVQFDIEYVEDFNGNTELNSAEICDVFDVKFELEDILICEKSFPSLTRLASDKIRALIHRNGISRYLE